MAQSNAIKDREFQSFVDSPTRDNASAREVYIGGAKSSIVNTSTEIRGVVATYFNSQTVASGGFTQTGSITVPSGKTIRLLEIKIGGDNLAEFTTSINSSTRDVSRSNFNQFEIRLPFSEVVLNSGDNIRFFTRNNGEEATAFQVFVKYDLYDEAV